MVEQVSGELGVFSLLKLSSGLAGDVGEGAAQKSAMMAPRS